MHKYKQEWNPDISVTNIERKVFKAYAESLPKSNSSLGYVKDTYIGELTPAAVNKLTDLAKFKFMKISDSDVKMAHHVSTNINIHYNPMKNNYGTLRQGLFKKETCYVKRGYFKTLWKRYAWY